MSIDPFQSSRIPGEQKENETLGATQAKNELIKLCKKIETLTKDAPLPKNLKSMIILNNKIILKWETMKLYPNQLGDKRLLDTLHDTIDKIEEFYGDLHVKLPLDLCAMTLEVTEKLDTLPPEAPKPKKNKRARTPISESSVTATVSEPQPGIESAASGSTATLPDNTELFIDQIQKELKSTELQINALQDSQRPSESEAEGIETVLDNIGIRLGNHAKENPNRSLDNVRKLNFLWEFLRELFARVGSISDAWSKKKPPK